MVDTVPQRFIDITFTLGKPLITGEQPTFAGTDGATTVKVSGLRVSCRIQKAGGVGQSVLQMQVWGLTLSIMNQISTLGMLYQLNGVNTVLVEAGNVGSAPSVAFDGTINNAWIDFQAAPEVALQILAYGAGAQAIATGKSTSYEGGASVADMMHYLATQMGYGFQNNGVTTPLTDQHVWSDPWGQAQHLREAANINMFVDNKILYIWPKYGFRGGDPISVSPDTGMVGYPTYTANGLMVRTVYNPAVLFGGRCQVQSIAFKGLSAAQQSLVGVDRIFNIYSLDHSLDAQVPGGDWFSTIGAYNLQAPAPIQ